MFQMGYTNHAWTLFWNVFGCSSFITFISNLSTCFHNILITLLYKYTKDFEPKLDLSLKKHENLDNDYRFHGLFQHRFTHVPFSFVKCLRTIDLRWGEIIFFYKMNEYENMLEEFELGTLSFSVICIRYKHPKGNYF